MRRSQRGAATLLVVAMSGVLLLLGAALGVVVAMVAAHREAQAASDLAALAAASSAGRGADACAAAERVARANGAMMITCRLDGFDATVTVTVLGPRLLGQSADLSATARAGPSGSLG
jgi:secretion/DNA translocation related TadE-like protein